MKLVKCIKDFGNWGKEGKYHLISNSMFTMAKNKKVVEFVCDVSTEDISMMLADFKINGVPEEIVKYFTKKS